jgi:hypothetical protein
VDLVCAILRVLWFGLRPAQYVRAGRRGRTGPSAHILAHMSSCLCRLLSMVMHELAGTQAVLHARTVVQEWRVILLAAAEIPSCVLAAVLIDVPGLGRRYSMLLFQLLCAVACILCAYPSSRTAFLIYTILGIGFALCDLLFRWTRVSCTACLFLSAYRSFCDVPHHHFALCAVCRATFSQVVHLWQLCCVWTLHLGSVPHRVPNIGRGGGVQFWPNRWYGSSTRHRGIAADTSQACVPQLRHHM